jgi:hypothetical protein
VQGGNTINSNRIYFTPFFLMRDCIVGALATRIALGQAGSSVQLGIYEAGPDGWPLGDPVCFVGTGNTPAALSSATAGIAEGNLATSTTFYSAKMYWAAAMSDSGIALQVFSSNSMHAASLFGASTAGAVSTSNTTMLGGGISMAGTFGQWPTILAGSFPFTQEQTTKTPIVLIRVDAFV